jgi:YidC/Oxa1 family membrane protein insertase
MVRDNLGSFKKEPLKEHSGNVMWSGVRSRYFIVALIPPQGVISKVLSFGSHERNVSGTQLAIPISVTGVTKTNWTLYLGPIDLWKLRALDVGLERNVNMGWSWIRPVSQLVLQFLVACHNVFPNYGLVIILLSALTKLLFYPLTKSSMKSMREMQKLQPEIQKLKEKHKKEPQRLNKEVMGLYKKQKVNPLGGCLPLLLQMPVFIALYNVLMHSIEMRRAHFGWWITDLSSPDTIAVVGGFAIHLLPILMGASMFWQQKMTPTDPRQAAMMYFMPVLMLVFFYSLPSGLVLYWTANNLMTIAQQYITKRAEKKEPAVEPAAGEKPKGSKNS